MYTIESPIKAKKVLVRSLDPKSAQNMLVDMILDNVDTTASIFKDTLPEIKTLDELLLWLSSTIIHFQADPQWLQKEDFAILITVITRAFIHLYLKDEQTVDIIDSWKTIYQKNEVPNAQLVSTTLDALTKSISSFQDTIQNLTSQMSEQKQTITSLDETTHELRHDLDQEIQNRIDAVDKLSLGGLPRVAWMRRGKFNIDSMKSLDGVLVPCRSKCQVIKVLLEHGDKRSMREFLDEYGVDTTDIEAIRGFIAKWFDHPKFDTRFGGVSRDNQQHNSTHWVHPRVRHLNQQAVDSLTAWWGDEIGEKYPSLDPEYAPENYGYEQDSNYICVKEICRVSVPIRISILNYTNTTHKVGIHQYLWIVRNEESDDQILNNLDNIYLAFDLVALYKNPFENQHGGFIPIKDEHLDFSKAQQLKDKRVLLATKNQVIEFDQDGVPKQQLNPQKYVYYRHTTSRKNIAISELRDVKDYKQWFKSPRLKRGSAVRYRQICKTHDAVYAKRTPQSYIEPVANLEGYSPLEYVEGPAYGHLKHPQQRFNFTKRKHYVPLITLLYIYYQNFDDGNELKRWKLRGRPIEIAHINNPKLQYRCYATNYNYFSTGITNKYSQEIQVVEQLKLPAPPEE